MSESETQPDAASEPAKAAESAPVPAKAADPPFRVQGMHVAAFAQWAAGRPRNMALLCVVVAVLALLYGIAKVVTMKSWDSEKMVDPAIPIVGVGGALMFGHRYLLRSRALLAIAKAAQNDPLAVWGVKNTWLYPLGPDVDRKKLQLILDANELRELYKKPRAPIETPRELA